MNDNDDGYGSGHVTAEPRHQALFADQTAAINKHEDRVNPLEVLSILSQLVGAVLLMQDSAYPMNFYMEVIRGNIELGNNASLVSAIGEPQGSA